MVGFGSSKNLQVKKASRKKHVDVDSLFQEALSHQKSGNLRNAEEIYKKIIRSGRLHSQSFLNLGDICQRTGRLRQAISLYEQAVFVNPKLFDARMKLGAIYKDIGDLDQAREEIMHALSCSPHSPRGLMNFMSVYKAEDFEQLKLSALNSVRQNNEIVNDLDFVEFVSSFGVKFCQDVLQSCDNSVASREA